MAMPCDLESAARYALMKLVAARLLQEQPTMLKQQAVLRAGRMMNDPKREIPVKQFVHALLYHLGTGLTAFEAEFPGAAVTIISWEDRP